MSTVDNFNSLVQRKGNPAIFHREDYTVPCPCRTPEGYRDPEFHVAHPEYPLCNEVALLAGPSTHLSVKGFVQPIQSTRATRLSAEYIAALVGQFQSDDHLGIFPVIYLGIRLEFRDWSQAGEDYIQHLGRRYIVVNANMIGDPSDGNPEHHWEVGLRLHELG